MDKWRAPLEVYDDVMKTDWTTITLADACKVTDADIAEVIGNMVCPRLGSCWLCPVGLMGGRVSKVECREALGKKLLERSEKHGRYRRQVAKGI